jgi:hypothetical protein
MIRFVNLTDPEEGSPICAFLSTDIDEFMRTPTGGHTFSTVEEIGEMPFGDRMIGLVPEGFFDEKPRTMTIEEYNEACHKEHALRNPGKERQWRFHWCGGKVEVGLGETVEAAFTHLGYGAGAIWALDYHEEIKC